MLRIPNPCAVPLIVAFFRSTRSTRQSVDKVQPGASDEPFCPNQVLRYGGSFPARVAWRTARGMHLPSRSISPESRGANKYASVLPGYIEGPLRRGANN